MTQMLKGATVLVLCAGLWGCSGYTSDPVIFGQAQVVGLSVGTNATNQTPELVLGYKDGNIAIMPAVARAADGSPSAIRGYDNANPTSEDRTTVEHGISDTLSVLGQFDLDAGGDANQTGVNVGLGKFFATGLAARTLAEGFAAKMKAGGDGAQE